jgi:hypothetical protein
LALGLGAGLPAAAAPADGAGAPTGSVPATDAAGTVWLCRPGLADDPCTADLTATRIPAQGKRTVVSASSATSSPYDCFYVYPTVSNQKTANSNLSVEPAEIGAAVSQASRFSSVCQVWAPMYRQRTSASLALGLGNDPTADEIAYQSLLAAWNDYLTNLNDGRPVVFIGHSQGAAMLIRLLAAQVDPDPTLRGRMVSAIILGGNVTVSTGQSVGATFAHLPLCTKATMTGCVIAYSSFPAEPPPDADFGRPGQGVSLQSGQTDTTGLSVACVNPAALAGGSAALSPYFVASTASPSPPVGTPWVTYPDLYSARCRTAGGATWLQVSVTKRSGDHRPVVTETLGPSWGFHVDDVNLALGNLVADVAAEEAAYHRANA